MKRSITTTLITAVAMLIAIGLFAASLVDLNLASQKDLEALKGVGPATAKKIIAARPYASVDELSKAGLSANQINSLRPMVTVAAAPARATARRTTVATTAASGPVDLNTASEKDLEALKGVGPATAKKIMAARPYSSVDQLTKAGLSAKQIDTIRPNVMVSAPAPARATRSASTRAVPSPAGPVDLNTGSEKELEALKGIGPATAKKIIAGRPYRSVGELSRAGVSAKVISEIGPNVTVSAPVVATTPTPAPAQAPTTAPASQPAPAPPVRTTQSSSTPTRSTPKLAPGQTVNINTASLEELDALPDIGPVKAQAIIDGRPYATIEDIMKVKGIKQGIFNKIKDRITVN